MGFAALEDKIVATSPGTRLPVSATAWQAGVESAITQLTATHTAVRINITKGQAHAGDVILLRLILVGGAGLVAVIVSSVLLLGFGNRISRELTGLRGAARTLAGERLPSVVSRLRAGDDVDVAVEAPPLDLNTRTREVTETADAFSVVQRTAVEAAVDQARLRKGVSLVFRSLARRNQSLLQRQLKLLDEMERGAEDPDALEQLFRLDHLTTRMRRQAEGLIILSGAAPGRAWRQPVPVVEVLRGAIGEIEDYARVDLLTDSPDFMQGTAVADVTHMLAELVENAVLYSAARHPGPGPGQPGGQRVRHRGRGPGPGHPGGHDGDAERAAGAAAGVRPRRQRPARPVRGQPAGCQARGEGLAARVGLRRHDRHRPAAPRTRRRGRSKSPSSPEGRRPEGRRAGRRRTRNHGPGRGRQSDRRGGDRSAALAACEPARHRAARPASGGRPLRACPVGSAWPASPRSCARIAPGSPWDRCQAGSPEQARALMSAIQRGWRSGRGTTARAATRAQKLGRAVRMMSERPGAGELDWLLKDLASSVPGVTDAVILSPDGLPLGRSPGLSENDGDRLAALAAGAQSLALGPGQLFGCGDVSQAVIEMDAALLFITPAGRGTCLALLAGADADAGQIAYEMAVLVKRVGQQMIANPRFPVQDPAAR